MSEFPFALPFIRWADVSTVAPRNPVALRRLYDHELIYVISGRGRIVLKRHEYAAQPDQILLIPPRVWHSFTAAPDGDFVLLGVHFDWIPQHDTLAFPLFRAADEPVDESRFRQARAIPHWDDAPFLDLRGRPRVRHALEEVVTAYNRFDEASPTIAGGLLAAVIGLISREARALQQLAANDLIGADALRRIERARAVLESDDAADQRLSMQQIAARVGWSGDHLRRMFRLALQVSPYQVQTQARLRRARRLLREENLPIAHIAKRCGFADASHFTRAFKKDCGLSPRQFLGLAKKL